jgi:hypothetical protein
MIPIVHSRKPASGQKSGHEIPPLHCPAESRSHTDANDVASVSVMATTPASAAPFAHSGTTQSFRASRQSIHVCATTTPTISRTNSATFPPKPRPLPPKLRYCRAVNALAGSAFSADPFTRCCSIRSLLFLPPTASTSPGLNCFHCPNFEILQESRNSSRNPPTKARAAFLHRLNWYVQAKKRDEHLRSSFFLRRRNSGTDHVAQLSFPGNAVSQKRNGLRVLSIPVPPLPETYSALRFAEFSRKVSTSRRGLQRGTVPSLYRSSFPAAATPPTAHGCVFEDASLLERQTAPPTLLR